MANAIRELEAKLGIGADTPGAAVEALMSNGAGASQWRAITAADIANVLRTDLAMQQTLIGNLLFSKDSPLITMTDITQWKTEFDRQMESRMR